MNQTFDMPIISARGIKHHCYPSERLSSSSRDLVMFMRVGNMGRIWITSDLQPLVPVQISLQLLPLQLLEVAVVQEKIIRMILTLPLFSGACSGNGSQQL
jgi:hypothetical protein